MMVPVPNIMDALIAKLTKPDTLRLHLGELDANELRIALAAVRYTLSQLQSLAFIEKVAMDALDCLKPPGKA